MPAWEARAGAQSGEGSMANLPLRGSRGLKHAGVRLSIYCDSILSATRGMASQRIAWVCLSVSLILGMVAMPGGWYALANGCMLKMTLTVKDTQDGFAGTTGTIWTIEPDCTFRVSRLFGQHVAEPHLKGTLTPEQQARLSAVLAQTAASQLPAQMGETPSVNARRMVLSQFSFE